MIWSAVIVVFAVAMAAFTYLWNLAMADAELHQDDRQADWREAVEKK